MRLSRLLAVLATAFALSPVTALQGETGQNAPSDRRTFRTSATLATIDAVVTDDDGRHVVDLSKTDFEVFVGGERRELQQAIYLKADMLVAPAAPETPTSTLSETTLNLPLPSATAALRNSRGGAGQITRTMAFVIDDLSLSFESTFAVRRAVSKFIESEMQPGDLVAILRTASGSGTLQQFTTDKRLLRIAIDRVQWDFRSRHAVTAFDPVTAISEGPNGVVGSTDNVDALRGNLAAVGSLAALQYIARGVQELPGRKSIVLFSEGFSQLFTDRLEGGRVWSALTHMLDAANRAGLVVYTIDARGLQTGGLTAEDDPRIRDWGVPGLNADRSRQQRHVRERARGRVHELLDSQESLQFIADQTGGLGLMNTNDLGRAIDRVLEDQQGYYLLGYVAPEEKLRSAWNHDGVEIHVKRPHVHVRARQGFFGPASPGDTTKTNTDPVLLALLSPFGESGLTTRLTCSFWYDGSKGSVRSMVFVDPNDLHFTEGVDRQRAELDVAIVAVDSNGVIVASSRRSLSLHLTANEYREARSRGIVYRSRLIIERPGPYQFRAAIRDVTTGRIGSASQFLEVPEVGKGKLALSGVLLKGLTSETPETVQGDNLEISPAGLSTNALLAPTIRILQRGTKAVFTYEIYDGLHNSKDLKMSTTLIRNGREVYRSEAVPVNAHASDMKVRVIPIGGSLDLGKDMPAGAYSLQVDVVLQRGNHIDGHASQWVDFEVTQ